MGRMAAMGSLEYGKAMATAPTRRPPMYTGLPLIPCNTPVVASGPPDNRARISDCRGPVFSSTPRISAWNSSTRLPEKTVLPVACIPGRISLRAKKPACCAESEAAMSTRLPRRRISTLSSTF